MKRKNLVVIMTDDQGYWTLGCAGNPDAHTPNIDRLAERGVYFENYFCVSPVCSPARASFFTGNIPSAHGVTDWLDGGNIDARKYEATQGPTYASERECIDYLEGQMTFPELLQENGYTCALAGKWHLGNSVQAQHGFSKWFSVPLGHSPYLDPPLIENGTVYQGKGFVTDLITEKTIDYLRELGPRAKEEDAPFYISVHYTAPHSPWGKLTQPARWFDYYKDCTFDSVPFEPMHKNAIFTNESPYFAFGAEAKEPEALRQELLSGYFGAIAAMDEGVGEIMKELEAQGLLEDTVVVFTSDNGMNTGHHGIWGKGNGTYPQNMYDTSVKIPFILYDRRVKDQGRVESSLYSHYDFLPTVTELLGLKLTHEEREKMEKLPGRSFVEVSEREAYDGERGRGSVQILEEDSEKAVVVYSEYGPVRMIRTRDWKYIHCYPQGPNELYDLKNDPGESHNLIDDPAQQERIWKMKYELDRWFVDYVDPRKDATKDNNTGNGQIRKNGLDCEGKRAFTNMPSIGIPYMEAIDLMKQQLARYIPPEE